MQTPGEWEEGLFREALRKAGGQEREAFLDAACAANEALRSRLAALLQAHASPDPFLESEIGDVLRQTLPLPAPDPALERLGSLIGRYKLLEKIGEGAFGVVYLAEQVQPVQRKVALKIIKAGMDTKEVIARFEAERQALALMDHPNIAKMLDGGVTETGLPYFVMELGQGIPITEYCDRNLLSTQDRLKLFVQICQAVQHAHQKGIIHRDLKPGNILVTRYDRDQKGIPMVIDFGVAKALGHKLTARTLCTGFARMIGTPCYMSPEQAQLSGVDIDTRSDIYSLGVLLYELLTGVTPFDKDTLAKATLGEARRMIRETEPPKPSTRLRAAGAKLGEIARRRQSQPRLLVSQVCGDLDWIVMKCLEKDRARRYESASLLALDIGHLLRHEPVLASPPSRLYQARKFIRRHRTPVLAGVMVFLALALGMAGALVGLAKASRERNRAQTILRQMDLKHAQDLFETDRAAEGLANLALLVRQQPDDLAVVEWLLNEMTQRSFPLPLLEPIKHEDRVLSARFSPNGSLILTVTRNNTARIWDAATGRPLSPPLTHDPGLVPRDEFLEGLHPMFANFSPDGTRVVTGAIDNRARIWDANTGRMLTPPLAHPNWVTYVCFSPDGKLVATACKDGAVRLWNAATGQAVGQPFQHATWANFVEFSPTGDRILTGSDDNTAQIWDVGSGVRLGQPLRHESELKYGEFSPDGERVVTASADFTARIWNGHTGQPASPPLKHDGLVCTAHFSPDGGRVVTASFDKTARLWDGFSGEPLGKPMVHKATVRSARFSPEGQRVVTASEDSTARVWDAMTGEPLSEPMLHHGYVWSSEFDRAGRRVLTASADATAQVWDARPGQALHHWFRDGRAIQQAQWTADGRRILMGTADHVDLCNASTGPWLSFGLYQDPTALLFDNLSPDGRYLVTAGGDKTARIWLTTSADRMLTRPLRHQARVHYAEFSPDCGQIVTASADGTARLWSAATGEPLGPPLNHRDIVFVARFSPSGREVLTASADGTACLWNPRSGKLVRPALLHPDQVTWACFSPDGRLAATVCSDMAARVWNLTSGRLVVLVRHLGPINSAAFSPDGRWLLTPSDDQTARVWEAGTGLPVSPPLAHNGHIVGAEFSADGQRVLTASEDGTARLWDARTGQCISEPFRHIKRLSAAHFHPEGNQVLTASLDHTARIWQVMRVRRPAAQWLSALAESVAGQRLDPQRKLEVVAPAEWFKWRGRLADSPAQDEYARWARWFCADRSARATSPSTTNTVNEFVSQLRELRGHEMECLREASTLDPASPRDHFSWLGQWDSTQPVTNRQGIAQLEWRSRKEFFDPAHASLAKGLMLARLGNTQGAATLLEEARRSAGVWDWQDWFYSSEAWYLAGRLEEWAQALNKSFEEARKTGHAEGIRVDGAFYLQHVPQGLRSEAQRMLQKLKGIRPRPADAPPNLVDLTSCYNSALVGWPLLCFYEGNLLDLPQGVGQVAATTFDIRGAVQLGSSYAPRQDLRRFAVIPVNQCCRRLHFLHAADSLEENGVKIGAYRMHYADSREVELPIIYGQDVLAWIDEAGATNAPGPVPVWQVRKPPGITVRLFQTTWTNPRPDIQIKTIDFVSAMTRSAPFLVALTAEP